MLSVVSSIGHAPTDRCNAWCSGIELADNESATVNGTCQISGSGITTSIHATNPGNVNFSGTLAQSNHSQGQLREVQRYPGHRL
jgi:hypothetical protein